MSPSRRSNLRHSQPHSTRTCFIQPRLIRTCNFQLHLQWNAATQRELGAKQTLTATYLGSDGRRLLRGDSVVPPALMTSIGHVTVTAIRNAGYSHYNAFQLQFQRRMSHGLQALVSYNLAKSSDLGSSDASGLRAQSLSAHCAASVDALRLRRKAIVWRRRLV